MVTVVFGARGNVGRHVAAGLLAAGEEIRVVSRDPAGLPDGLRDGAQAVAADLASPESLPAALDGADKVFLYAVSTGVDGFVSAALAAGVRQVVLLSSAAVVGAAGEGNPIAGRHEAVERAIQRSGLDWTFVRPGMFAGNVRWVWGEPIRKGRAVRVPFPDAQSAPVHEKDIAALAVTALTEAGHSHQPYTVYGAHAVTVGQMVADIGAALGREIPVEVISPEQAHEELAASMGPAGARAILGAWQAGARGPAATSVIIERITGRPAHTFAQWAEDHVEDFRL